MAHLNDILLGRDINAEGTAEIVNVSKLTVTNPAVDAEDVMRKQEVDGHIAAITGSATTFTDFGLVEAELVVLDGRADSTESRLDALESFDGTVSVTKAVALTWVDNGDGTWTASAAHGMSSSLVDLAIQSDEGLGNWHYISGIEVDIDIDANNLMVHTNSATMASKSLRAVITGIEA